MRTFPGARDSLRSCGTGHTNRGSQLAAAPKCLDNLAPEVGLEPTTLRLTAGCSTIELLRNVLPLLGKALN